VLCVCVCPSVCLSHTRPSAPFVSLQLWFRNTWSFNAKENLQIIGKPKLHLDSENTCPRSFAVVVAEHETLGNMVLQADQNLATGANCPCTPMFTENEDTFTENEADGKPYVKDAFHRRVVNGEVDATNPANVGTKAGLHYSTAVPPKGSVTFRFRLFNPADGADAAKALVLPAEQVKKLAGHVEKLVAATKKGGAPPHQSRRGWGTVRQQSAAVRRQSAITPREDIEDEFVCAPKKALQACDLDTEAVTVRGQVILMPRQAGSDEGAEKFPGFGLWFETMCSIRKREADEFYDEVRQTSTLSLLLFSDTIGLFSSFLQCQLTKVALSAHQIFAPSATEGGRKLARLAYAGMLCSKQFYCYSVAEWLKGDPHMPAPPEKRLTGRNSEWKHRE
jgi:hypothetical protein